MFKKLLIAVLALSFFIIYAPVNATTLLRASGDSKVYEIINGQKHWIPTAEVFNARGYGWSQIQTVTQAQLNQYAQARLLMDESSKKVYYLNSRNQIKWLINEMVFSAYGNKWSDVIEVSLDEINSYQKVNLVRAQNQEKVYLLEGITKRWIQTAQAFSVQGYNWEDIDVILPAELDAYTIGSDITSQTQSVSGTPTVQLKINGLKSLSASVPASYTLSWQSFNTSSCSASGNWSGNLATTGNYNFSSIASGSYSYLITCTGEGGQTITDSVSAVISQEQVNLQLTLKINDQTEDISPIYPASYTLSWSGSLELDACAASGSWGGDRDRTGSYPFSNQEIGTYTYILTCTDTESGQSISDSISATVRNATPPTLSFFANSSYSSISPSAPASFTLDWTATNANYCNASGAWSGIKDVSGYQSFADVPAGYRNYILNCYNDEGSVSSTVVVDVD